MNRIVILLLVGSAAFPGAKAQTIRQVEWEATYAKYDENIGQGADRLVGNVVFRHEGALMYCDSAYYYARTNSLDAFSNVHINQGDTIHVYGDFMHYDGNSRIAEITGNVLMEGQNTLLRTIRADYDLGRNIGYYTQHGDIESGDNQLKSRIGYYYADSEMYFFRDSVVLINPDYTMYSDSLRYHVPDGMAFFTGPTEIISDSGYIYCEDGWYNTETDISMLKVNVIVQNKSQVMKGDSIYYERETGYGEAYANIELVDTEQNIILRGNRAFVNEDEDRALLTDSALFIYITDDDSIYVHADTLRTLTDTAGNREFKAYYDVRFYKSNLQGKCDSLFYSAADSILRLYVEPVLWAGVNQMSAEYIEIRTKNKQINELEMDQVAFIINQEDSNRFNQIKGRSMVCYFHDNDIYRIDTKGNGQTVYWVKDNDELIGVNLAESSDLTIFFQDNEVYSISYLIKPTAILYPPEMAPRQDLILNDFIWYEDVRPKDKHDIYRR